MEAAGLVRLPAREEAPITTKVIQLLLVEDNDTDTLRLRNLIAEPGVFSFNLLRVKTLSHALDEVGKQSFDAILLDLGLPDSQGLEGLSRLRRHAPRAPIIVITQLSDEEQAIQAARAGAQDYLLKGQITGPILARAILCAIEVQARESQLRQSAMRQLTRGIAHDFNNVLTMMNGYSDMALMGMLPENPIFGLLTEARKAGDSAADLIRQLQTLGSNRPPHPQNLDLNHLVSGMRQMLSRIVGENIELSVVLQPDIGPVWADPTQIDQVITNLVVNARNAMPSGGRLVLETSAVTLDQKFRAEDVEINQEAYVLFTATDTGQGMDNETLTHIFEPFLTTKESVKSTGLSLAVVSMIVKQSRGFIQARSKVPSGTTFKVYLPRILKAAPEVPDRLSKPSHGAVSTRQAEMTG